MAAPLTAAQVARYRRDGSLAPLPLLTDVSRYRDLYDAYEASVADDLSGLPAKDRYVYLAETHLYLSWVYELATEPTLLDVIASILGPDLLLWDSRWFTKPAGSGAYVSWRQDATYWSLDPPVACTAWIALSRSYRGNGCMRVVPGSHVGAPLPHRDTHAPDNALARGQEITVAVDEAQAKDIVLEPGECSLHDVAIVHGADANTSAEPRIGIALPPRRSNRQVGRGVPPSRPPTGRARRPAEPATDR